MKALHSEQNRLCGICSRPQADGGSPATAATSPISGFFKPARNSCRSTTRGWRCCGVSPKMVGYLFRTELIAGKGRILAMHLLDRERRVRFITAHSEIITRDLDSSPGTVTSGKLEGFTQEDECAVKVTASFILQLSNQDGVLRTWDLTQTGAVKPSSRKIADNALSGCAISDDGRLVYVKPDGKLAVLARTDIAGAPSIPLSRTGSEVIRVAFSPQAERDVTRPHRYVPPLSFGFHTLLGSYAGLVIHFASVETSASSRLTRLCKPNDPSHRIEMERAGCCSPSKTTASAPM
jgi:hypothetical protein